MKDPSERYTVCVDFDGVIHSYTSPWIDAETIPDPPVPQSIQWLCTIAQKFDVVILTTRGETLEGRQAVARWLTDHGLVDVVFRVTSEKVKALIYIDDRGYRFTGPGSLPTANEIHELRPWNKPRKP